MRIYSLSKVLSFPLVVIAGIIILNTFVGYRSEYSIYIFIPVILLVALYIFHGVIDFWWLEKNPIPLEPKMKEWFTSYSPYYNHLEQNEKVKFENRLSLYVEGREFKSVGTSELKEVPYDIKCIIASQNIMLTAGMSDYLLGDMDRIYMYKHAFPSPRFKYLHTVETHIEDGMILLSSEHALPGITHPESHYNIALHAYAEAFTKIYPHYDYPTVNHHGWNKVEEIIGLSKSVILKTTGHETLEILPLHIVMYFLFPDEYETHFHNEANAFRLIFNN